MNDTTEIPTAPQYRLTSDLRTLADDAEALLRHAVQDAGEGYAGARARLEQSVARAKEQLAGADQAVRSRVRETGGAVDEYVHENPWRAICVGAGVGLLAGLLLARR